MRSFAKIKPPRNSENALSLSVEGKLYRSREFFTWQICLLTLLAKIKFSRKFPNLQYLLAEISIFQVDYVILRLRYLADTM